MQRLEKLLMRVELIDKVTGPANKLIATVDKLTNRATVGFANVAVGVGSLVGLSAAVTGLTRDSRDMYRAIGEVKSLSVADDALQKLERSALRYSITYGESATAFVRSAYDIQSAIGGLTGTELSKFTEASNVLAKATKSDASTITNYMGTMYGIFKNNAEIMGKSKWVEQLTGQTAQAVEMFKTTGSEMSAAFTSLGADAQAHGVAINEQMSVLGKLQATMSGSESGTKYKAFLRGVGNAQKVLGMQFTDSAGKMLPVDVILSKLQEKFGAIDTVAKGDMLKKAFGSDEAVAAIKLLIADTNGLTDAMNKLGNVTGMDKANNMAQAMVDPIDQLSQANTALRISFGQVIHKAMVPFYAAGTKGLSTVNDWITQYPYLAGLIAKTTLVVLAIGAAIASLTIAKGVLVVTSAGLGVGMALLRIVMLPFGPLLGVLRMAWLVFNTQLAVGAGLMPALRAAFVAMRTQLVINAAAVWGLNAALLANPITWIVLGVVALIAGLVMLVKHWDNVKAATLGFFDSFVSRWQKFRAVIENTTVLKFLFTPLLRGIDLISLVLSKLKHIPAFFSGFTSWFAGLNPMQSFSDGLDWIVQKWQAFRALLADNAFLSALFFPLTTAIDGVGLLINAFKKIPEWFASFKKWLANLNPFDFIQRLDTGLTNLLNKIPGINIGKVVPEVAVGAVQGAQQIEHKAAEVKAELAPQKVSLAPNTPPGGISQQLNNINNTNRGTHIGALNVTTTQPVDGYSLRDQLVMAS